MTYTVCAGNLLSTTQSKHENLGLTLEGAKGSLSNVSYIGRPEEVPRSQAVSVYL